MRQGLMAPRFCFLLGSLVLRGALTGGPTADRTPGVLGGHYGWTSPDSHGFSVGSAGGGRA